jgi:hypothetical protein
MWRHSVWFIFKSIFPECRKWGQQVPLKRRSTSTRRHVITSLRSESYIMRAAGCEVQTLMVVMPCCLIETHRRFGRACFVYMQGRGLSQVEWDLLHYSFGCSLNLVFNLEDRSNAVLRNIDYPYCTVSRSRRWNCFPLRSDILIVMGSVIPVFSNVTPCTCVYIYIYIYICNNVSDESSLPHSGYELFSFCH